MTRNISKSHLAKVFSRVGGSNFFFGERSGERLNIYFCMNVHLLSEQLVAVTQKLDELWKLDHLLLLRLLLLLLLLRLRRRRRRRRLLLLLLLLYYDYYYYDYHYHYHYHYYYYYCYYYYYYDYHYSCSCFGGRLCHKTLPRKRRKFGESSAQDWRKFTLPHLTPSPL